ncbi:MAG: OPT/YSL family transporter, partial [Phycisphaerales bacterium]|nr:OPT/YSL family transporter [Phycisphaerales bacterium]
MSEHPTDGQPTEPDDSRGVSRDGAVPGETRSGHDEPDHARAALPTGGGYKEVTLTAVVVGVLIGIVMNASITYAGLKIGFTIGGSAIAAVLGFGVLKIMRRGTVVETNIVQTVASAVNTSNSGVIFTVPVLILLGFTLTWSDANFWLLTLASIAGAIMGTVFIIPLRKQMIDIDRLRFPSATGVATILKSPGAGIQKFLVLIAGVVIGAAIYLPVALAGVVEPVEVTGAELLAGNVEQTSPLGVLVERSRISPEEAARTIEMASWIETRNAPDDLLARGGALHERKALLGEVSTLADESE